MICLKSQSKIIPCNKSDNIIIISKSKNSSQLMIQVINAEWIKNSKHVIAGDTIAHKNRTTSLEGKDAAPKAESILDIACLKANQKVQITHLHNSYFTARCNAPHICFEIKNIIPFTKLFCHPFTVVTFAFNSLGSMTAKQKKRLVIFSLKLKIKKNPA